MRSCRICSFFLFCFLSTTSGLGEVKDEVGGGGGSFNKEWKYIIAKQ